MPLWVASQKGVRVSFWSTFFRLLVLASRTCMMQMLGFRAWGLELSLGSGENGAEESLSLCVFSAFGGGALQELLEPKAILSITWCSGRRRRAQRERSV